MRKNKNKLDKDKDNETHYYCLMSNGWKTLENGKLSMENLKLSLLGVELEHSAIANVMSNFTIGIFS